MDNKAAPSKRDKASKKREHELLRIGKHVTSQFTMQLIRDGLLSTKGKSDEQIRAEIIALIRSNFLNDRNEFFIGTDHAKDILAEARKLLRQKKLERSALHFSTYFEHQINWLILQICKQKRLSDDTTKQVLKEANIRAKCTWVLTLLDHKPIKPAIVKTIESINEIRNAFVHYKWPVRPADDPEEEASEKRRLATLKNAEVIVRYLRGIEERTLYMGDGKRLRKILKPRTNAKQKPTEKRKAN